MAGLENIDTVVENHVVDTLEANTGYQIARYSKEFTPEQLYDWLKARINTALGSVFVRVSDMEFTQVDTLGRAYTASVQVECLIGYPAVRQQQMPDTTRKVNEIKIDVKRYLLANPVAIDDTDGNPDGYYFELNRDTNLFQDSNLDVVMVRLTVEGIYVEY